MVELHTLTDREFVATMFGAMVGLLLALWIHIGHRFRQLHNDVKLLKNKLLVEEDRNDRIEATAAVAKTRADTQEHKAKVSEKRADAHAKRISKVEN